MRNNEHQEAVALVQWWGLRCKGFGVPKETLFAIPNGGHRHPAVAIKMKQEGVIAGVPDYFLAVARGGLHGLFLELKAPKAGGGQKGRLSDNQKIMIGILKAQGYGAVCCFGWAEASKNIEDYIKETGNYSTEDIVGGTK